MLGPIVIPEAQAEYISDYLQSAIPKVDGIIYCGWSMKGYGFRGYSAEEIIKENFNSY